MKILTINHYAGNATMGMVFRPYYLGLEWLKEGHEVTIVGASFSHLRNVNPIVKNLYTVEWIDGIKYIWIKTPAYKKNDVFRIINIISFLFVLLLNFYRIVKDVKPDVVISSPTYNLDIFIAYVIAKLSNARFIYEVRDLWPLVPMELGGYSSYHPFIVLMSMAEQFAFHKAFAVVSIAPHTLDYMKDRGLKPEKFKHISNGVSLYSIQKQQELDYCLKESLLSIKTRNIKVVGYIGSVRNAYSLKTLLYSANTLRDEALHFCIVGKGNQLDTLKEIISDLDLNNVTLLPPVSKSQVPALLSYFDVCYLGFQKCRAFSYGVGSNKLFDYMLSAKPIVLSVDTPYASLVDVADCGLTIPAESPEMLSEALRTLSSLPQSRLLELGRNGNNYVSSNYDYTRLAKQYMELFE